MAKLGEPRVELMCSFCGKSQTAVAKLVAGPGVYICDECVALCCEIIAGEGTEMPTRMHWERLLADDKLLATLPTIAAAGGQADRQLALWVKEARSRGITWTRIGAALGMTRQSAWERFSGEE